MAVIQVLEDLQKAYQDYPHVYLDLEIIDVAVPGQVLDVNDDATFNIRATNRGPVNMNKVALRVTGLNGTQVKSNGAAAVWGSSFDLSGDYFGDVPANNERNPVVAAGRFHFKPTSASSVSRDLIRVEVTGWDADADHLFIARTKADPEAKAVYGATVSPT